MHVFLLSVASEMFSPENEKFHKGERRKSRENGESWSARERVEVKGTRDKRRGIEKE